MQEVDNLDFFGGRFSWGRLEYTRHHWFRPATDSARRLNKHAGALATTPVERRTQRYDAG
jgi:hypothetical protein